MGNVAQSSAQFRIGQRVHHRLFRYRGVVVDVDPGFQGSDDWYRQVARSRPPRNRPWYRVLVHRARHETYVAERNLEPDSSDAPVVHPLLEHYFSGMKDGVYQSRLAAH